MGYYIVNVCDFEFNLFEVFDIGVVLGIGCYSDLDVDMVCIILVEVVWLVEGLIVEFFGYVDCNLLVFDLNIYFISVFDELVKIV